MIIGGLKVTGDIGEAIRFAKGLEEAREFLVKSQRWSEEKFDQVDWKMLDKCLKGKPDGYKMCLTKQHSGACGTRVQVGYYSGDPEADTSCPNCGDREDAAHLCQCPDEDRTRLLCEFCRLECRLALLFGVAFLVIHHIFSNAPEEFG